MPRKRRQWRRYPLSTTPLKRLKITISSSGSTGAVTPPAKPIPLAEAVALNLEWARDWHGDRAVARFLWERDRAAKGQEYDRESSLKAVGDQMGMTAKQAKWLINRSKNR
jgi:hypothetical protein